MKIIITGSTGAFGAAMVRFFYAKGYEIIATGRKSPPRELLKYATYVQADITQPFSLPKADVCIHGAALSDDKAKMKQLHAPNIMGTGHVLDAAKQCEKFIFISSSSVYLPQANPIEEKIGGKQNNKHLSPYGYSKLCSENVVRENYTGESAFILRPRAFYGVGDTQIIPRMLKLVKKDIFQRPGKLDIHLSMTHYDNIGHAIMCCIKSDLKGIRTYNVADDQEYVMLDTLRSIFKSVYKKELPEKEININLLKVLAFFKVGGLTPLLVRALTQNMVLDITKLKQELGYSSLTNLANSLPQIEAWVDELGGAEQFKNITNKVLWNNS